MSAEQCGGDPTPDVSKPTNNLSGGEYTMKAIIGKKVGMSQIFDENGHVIPVTVIEAGSCTVVQK